MYLLLLLKFSPEDFFFYWFIYLFILERGRKEREQNIIGAPTGVKPTI